MKVRCVGKDEYVYDSYVRNNGRNIDTSLARIYIALSPNLGVVSKESPRPLKERDVGHKLKRIVTIKILNRRTRPTIDGWRLNDKDFDELNRTYSFTLVVG